MPEYHNMKRLDYFANRLYDWCQSRIRSSHGYDLLRRLFMYDPERRLTAREALQHKWFLEEPRPTWKYVHGLFHLKSQAFHVSFRICAVPLQQSPLTKSHPNAESRKMKHLLWCLCRRTLLIKEPIT